MELKFKSFEAAVLYFHGMYKLPIASAPSFAPEVQWQRSRSAEVLTATQAIEKRFKDFFKKILQDELNESDSLLSKVRDGTSDIDLLVELADLLGDLQIYCASEMVRFGIPNKEVLDIITQSNFSKLGADGNPIYDETGKVMKGPNYWKPEPRIKELLLSITNQEDTSHGPTTNT